MVHLMRRRRRHSRRMAAEQSRPTDGVAEGAWRMQRCTARHGRHVGAWRVRGRQRPLNGILVCHRMAEAVERVLLLLLLQQLRLLQVG
jgi:hypothetical protein